MLIHNNHEYYSNVYFYIDSNLKYSILTSMLAFLVGDNQHGSPSTVPIDDPLPNGVVYKENHIYKHIDVKYRFSIHIGKSRCTRQNGSRLMLTFMCCECISSRRSYVDELFLLCRIGFMLGLGNVIEAMRSINQYQLYINGNSVRTIITKCSAGHARSDNVYVYMYMYIYIFVFIYALSMYGRE